MFVFELIMVMDSLVHIHIFGPSLSYHEFSEEGYNLQTYNHLQVNLNLNFGALS